MAVIFNLWPKVRYIHSWLKIDKRLKRGVIYWNDLIGKSKEESCLKVNLDTYDDVAKDYRFYEDPGDEFRQPPDGVSFHFYIPSQSQMIISKCLGSLTVPQ